MMKTKIPLWLALSAAAVVEIFLLFALMDVQVQSPFDYQAPPTSSSDAVPAIESDLETIDVGGLEQDLNQLEQEVNQ